MTKLMHYKNRRWLIPDHKLCFWSTDILSDNRIVTLRDSEKGALFSIISFCTWIDDKCEFHARPIVNSPIAIKKLCYLDEEPNLYKYISLGLLKTVNKNEIGGKR
tara:strand:+ start:2357 stop:2671 length:315 start_codon:yes stop_codon:yes gene_type:complete